MKKNQTGNRQNPEMNRYARHILLPQVGREGQNKLKSAKVLVIGAGGLGSPALLYLAAAGVGSIGIIDFDAVEESNLTRQIIHTTKNIGRQKVVSAQRALEQLNPSILVTTYPEKFSGANAEKMVKKYDVIIDGSDSLAARFLANDACFLNHKPLVYGSVFQFEGHVSVFNYQDGPCYRCMVPQQPPDGLIGNCAEGGVLGVVPGVIGVLQATEAIKIILSVGDVLSKRLLRYHALAGKFTEYAVHKNKNCPLCSKHQKITAVSQENITGGQQYISPRELENLLAQKNDVLIIDVREANEWQAGHLPCAQWIPLSTIQQGNFGMLKSLPKNKEIIVYCRSGSRSAFVCRMLHEQGFGRVRNLAGGLKAYAHEILPQVTVL